MTEETMARSVKHLVDEAMPRWEDHLRRLQARRDRLLGELDAANVAIAEHIQYKNTWIQYSASLVAAAQDWQGENSGKQDPTG